MDAVTTGSNVEGLNRSQLKEEMEKIHKEILTRLPVGWSTSYQSLVKEFVRNQGYSVHALERTIFALEKSDVLRYASQKKVIRRCVVCCSRCGVKLIACFIESACKPCDIAL